MKLLGRSAVAVAVMVCVMVSSVMGQAMPEVLSKIPATAPGFMAVANLKKASDKLAMLNQELGLEQPEMADTLAMIQQMTGVEKGLNADGSMAIIMLTMPDPDGAEPLAVALIPVTDYKAFLGNFQATDTGGITPISMFGEPAFAKKSGNFAVVSDSDKALNAYVDNNPADVAKSVGSLGKLVAAGSDMMVYMDMAVVGPVALPMINEAMATMKADMPAEAGAEGAMAIAVLDVYADVLRTMMTQGQAVLMGMDLDQQGVGLSGSIQFKPGSDMAKTFANAPEGKVNFNRLPARPFMFAASLNMKALPLAKWITDFAAKLPAGTPMATMIKSAIPTLEATEVQQAMYPPDPNAPAPSLFSAINVYVTDKPDQLKAAYRQSVESLNNLALLPGMTYQTTYVENVMQVAGKPVDQYSVKFNMPPEAMAEMGPLAMFIQGMNGYVATADGALIGTSGSDPVLLNEAVKAAAGGKDLTANPLVQSSQSKLLPHRMMEGYVGVSAVLQMVGNFVAMFAPEMQFNFPGDLPPIAFGISMNEGGAGKRLYIPMRVMKTVAETMKKLDGPQAPPPPVN
jgi:hypothetical protein